MLKAWLGVFAVALRMGLIIYEVLLKARFMICLFELLFTFLDQPAYSIFWHHVTYVL